MSDSCSDESSCSSEDGPKNRKTNRSLWGKYTDQERGVHASLVRERNEDLALHLYNAYILRQRAEEFEKDPLNAKINFEYPGVPEMHRTFRPPNRWTAWPLTPEDVPRAAHNTIKNDGLDSYTLKKQQIEWPSRELEEELLAVGLRFAREMFEKRESENIEENGREASIPVGIAENEIGLDGEEGSRSGSLGSCKVLEQSSDFYQSLGRTKKTYLKPVFCYDDDKSRLIFKPSIRHIIIDIEKVLKGLHESRKSYFSLNESKSKRNKNPSLKSDLEIRSREKSQANDLTQNFEESTWVGSQNKELQNQEPLLHTPQKQEAEIKKSRRGRPRKVYERIDGETEKQYLVRIARKKKKTIPTFSPPLSPIKPKKPETIPPARKYTKSTTDRLKKRQRQLRLRDWSEVLGSAALVGISADAVARAAQRCANIFDERIIIRTMTEASHENKKADSTVCYRPTKSLKVCPSAHLPVLCNSNLHSRDIDVKESKKYSSFRRVLTNQTQFCPIDRCPRMLQKFKHQNALLRHLKKSHNIERAQAESSVLPNHEDMEGAVHIDGFLRGIQSRACMKGDFQTSQGIKHKDADMKAESSDEDSGEVEHSSNSSSSSSIATTGSE